MSEKTTKRCKCGCVDLVTLPSLNLKLCPECKAKIVWEKGELQSDYWG